MNLKMQLPVNHTGPSQGKRNCEEGRRTLDSEADVTVVNRLLAGHMTLKQMWLL